nr:hypothetical protein [Tanacetum cinerariifolium]
MPPKPDLVFHTAIIAIETDHSTFTVQLSNSKHAQDLSHIYRPSAPIIEDWVSDYEDESETTAPQNVPTATPKLTSPKSNSSGKRRNRKTCFVCKSVDHLIKDCDHHTKKMAQPTPRNYAHRVLTQYKPVSNTAVRPVSAAMPKFMVTRPRLTHPTVTKSKSPIRRHITRSPSPKTSNSPPRVTTAQAPVVSAAQGNPKGGKIYGKGKIKTGKLDFEDVYFVKELKFNLFSASQIVPRENNMYNVNLKNIVPSGDLTCLFAKKIINPINSSPSSSLLGVLTPKRGEEVDQQYVLFPVWSSGSTNPQNNDEDVVFNEKEHDAKKPDSEVNVSPSSSAQIGKQDDKTKKKTKWKSLVESFIGYRDLSGEFEDCSENSSNEVNAVEADFNNLETSIIVSPIPTTRIHKDHPDERGIVVRNKARLVTQGHTEDDGINYKEVFAPVARIEAIRLFLAYAFFMGFMVYQMDDPNHPDKVYKVVKALYGLHQAPRAWYETLATYLLENGFQRGKIDQTLFIKKQKGDILLVQIYVDDIIFGAINKDLCKYFEKLMKEKFQMSSIGELTFFLGKSASTPIDTEKPLLKDPGGEDVDVHICRSMIGSLMCLTSSRPDIIFDCKKQTVVATSSTEAEYVAATNCFAQVLWIQNQLLDYREDLEALWNLVKERFSTSKPKNFSDNFLLNTLGAMFEKPNGQDQVWKNQRSIHGQAKVKSWKLLESCGVHIITSSTTQLILLVERRYQLSSFGVDDAMDLKEKHSKCLMLLVKNLVLPSKS